MGTGERLAEILQAVDRGVIDPSQLHVHVGFMLAEFGSAKDVIELPLPIKGRLIGWAREFEQNRTWWLLSNAGQRDVSATGERLLALIQEAGCLVD